MQTTRALATVAQVSEVKPIDGADFIQLACFQDRSWEVIVGKDIEVGDVGILFEIDSFLPEEFRYDALRKTSFTKINNLTGFRVRSLKLRGVYSQGFFLKMSEFEGISFPTRELGADCTNILGVLQWPEDIVDEKSKSTFPSDIVPKTESARIENLTQLQYDELLSRGSFVCTEKLDGTSFTAYYTEKDGFVYCSRNCKIVDTDNDTSVYGQISRKYMLMEFLKTFNSPIAIQGEIIGPGIQGNRYKRKELELYLFFAWDIERQTAIPLTELLSDPMPTGISIPVVPTIKLEQLPSRPELRKLSDGKSCLHNTAREGFVLRFAANPNQSYKVISREFLCKQK